MSSCTKLQDLILKSLTNQPDKIAIRFHEQHLSYSQLQQQVNKLATGLLEQQVMPGDRVAFLLPNCPESVMMFMACYQIGAVAVPLNYRYLEMEVRYVLEDIKAKLFIFDQSHINLARSISDCLPTQQMFVLNLLDQVHEFGNVNDLFDFPILEESVKVDVKHPAFILYTSGSTGKPKGVVHSHEGAYHAIDISRKALDFSHMDIVLVGKPISHAGGLQTQLMPVLSVSGEIILTMKPSPADAVALIKRYSVTEYGMLASDLLDFIEYLEAHPTTLNSLKNAIGSGDSVPVDLHHRWRDIFGWEVLEGCGMTEFGCYYAMNPRYAERKWGAMGLPCPETTIRIINKKGEEVATRETGELLVKSASVTTGYWLNEAATQHLFSDEWLLTGDLGYKDEQGYLWFVGRKKLMIIRRGSNISPVEVENVLDEHPSVHASVVVGIADKRDGQVPVACIAPIDKDQMPTEPELRTFISERLARYKNPAHYLFLAELPRNSTGKFDRHDLEEKAKDEFGS